MSEFSEVLKQVLFVGGHGYVVALDKDSGSEIWRTSLPNCGYGFVNVLLDDGRIFAASGGKMYCLDANDGRLIWQNRMTGLGYGIYSFATVNRPGDSAANEAAHLAEQEKRRRSN